MPLYQTTTNVQDGENEYQIEKYVLAGTFAQASAYAKRYAKEEQKNARRMRDYREYEYAGCEEVRELHVHDLATQGIAVVELVYPGKPLELTKLQQEGAWKVEGFCPSYYEYGPFPSEAQARLFAAYLEKAGHEYVEVIKEASNE